MFMILVIELLYTHLGYLAYDKTTDYYSSCRVAYIKGVSNSSEESNK